MKVPSLGVASLLKMPLIVLLNLKGKTLIVTKVQQLKHTWKELPRRQTLQNMINSWDFNKFRWYRWCLSTDTTEVSSFCLLKNKGEVGGNLPLGTPLILLLQPFARNKELLTFTNKYRKAFCMKTFHLWKFSPLPMKMLKPMICNVVKSNNQ